MWPTCHSQAKERIQSLCQSSSYTQSNKQQSLRWWQNISKPLLGHSNIFLTLHSRHKSPAWIQPTETWYKDHGGQWVCWGPAPSEQLQHRWDPQPQQQGCEGCVRMAAKEAYGALPWIRHSVCPAVGSGSSHDPKDSPQTGSLSCLAATGWGHLLTESWLRGTDHLEKHDMTVLYEHYPCCQCAVTSAQSQTEDLWSVS